MRGHAGKKRFAAKRDAIRACLKTSAKYGHGMRPYYCQECKGWHISKWSTPTRPPEEQAELDYEKTFDYRNEE